MGVAYGKYNRDLKDASVIFCPIFSVLHQIQYAIHESMCPYHIIKIDNVKTYESQIRNRYKNQAA